MVSIRLFACVCWISWVLSPLRADDFQTRIAPLLKQYCASCHSGDEAKGDVQFSTIRSTADALKHNELWSIVADLIDDREMPPEDAPQPSEQQREVILRWIEEDYFGLTESRPTVLRPRRLSGPEYRNTMRSMLGFDLEVNVAKAEQTVTETSLVLKLLPTDPPGESGFVNDTHRARISTTIWEQYAYLADFGLQQYFESRNDLDPQEAEALLREFLRRAMRRPVPEDRVASSLQSIHGKSGNELIVALKQQFKQILLSPAFLYRGLLVQLDQNVAAGPVDDFELAERLSYFLWEDMPDEELFELAQSGTLHESIVLREQVERMLSSEKSRNLAESFGSQWLLLDQIKHQRRDPPYEHALKTQPLDFLHYLFTENRPVMELIDSDVTFINTMIGNFYGNERKQLAKFIKPKGIERMAMPLQKVTLQESLPDRGAGILTMPGVLSMNSGPILRGTWMLRQILGEHLGEPPPNVPPIQAAAKGKNLNFRERFEVHRSDKSCALCHDKIDPLGFALDRYDPQGGVIGKGQSKKKKNANEPAASGEIDTSGMLPSGEKFNNFHELRELLRTTQRDKIVRNAVRRMMAYALCRPLQRTDRPTVDGLTEQIVQDNGTWKDLIIGIVESVPFQQAQRQGSR